MQVRQPGVNKGSGMRFRAEQVTLTALAGTGGLVLLADLIGWIDGAGGEALARITLLILSGVTLFLLLEVDRLEVLDNVNRQLSKLDIDGIARGLKHQHYCGVVQVHPRFPEDHFTQMVQDADREVTILQTWIPNLRRFQWALKGAIVDRRADIRILLLHPMSQVAKLREEALGRDPALAEDVKSNVERCLSILGALAADVPLEDQARLQVRVYNSLPSIAVYKADERYLISSFLHGQLAIDSPQTEVDGSDTAIGEEVEREFETLWRIGRDIDLADWRQSLAVIDP